MVQFLIITLSYESVSQLVVMKPQVMKGNLKGQKALKILLQCKAKKSSLSHSLHTLALQGQMFSVSFLKTQTNSIGLSLFSLNHYFLLSFIVNIKGS